MSLLLLFKGAGGGGTPQSTEYPDVVLQWAPDAGPSTPLASTSWVNIPGSDIREGSTNRGRSVETDDFQAGTMAVTLANALRTYDPDYTAGAYYGKLKPNRRIRALTNFNGVTYPVFNGFIGDEFVQEYFPPNDAHTTITCTDGFGILQSKVVNSSGWAETIKAEIALGVVFAWYRMNDKYGVAAADAAGTNDGTFINFADPLPTTSGLVAYDSDAALTFTGGRVQTAYDPTHVAPNWLEAWIQTTTTGTEVIADGPGAYLYIVSGQLGFGLPDSLVQQAGPLVNDGRPHHIFLRLDGSGTDWYIDGVNYTGSLAAGAVTAGGAEAGYFVAVGGRYDASSSASNIVFDEVVWFIGPLSAADVLAHYNAGTAPYDGDTTGTRIGRILDLAGWPTADRNIASGSKILGPMNLSGTALELIKKCEASEQGRFFISADGLATFQDCYVSIGGATAKATSTTVQATFGDAGSELPYFHDGFRLKKAPVRNSVTGQRDGGASITLQDSTSIDDDDYGERPWSVGGLANQNDNDVRALLQHQLQKWAQPVTQSDGVTLKPRTIPATMWPAVLGFEISKRYELLRRPQSVGTAIDLTVLLEGVAHHFSPMEWDCTPFFSAADTRSDWFILDTSALDTGVLAF